MGVMRMLEEYEIETKGAEAVVIGRSNIVGKPMAQLLLRAHATVTICHSRTRDLAAHTREADILVAAVGKLHVVTADMVKPGAAVIDVGMNRTDDGLFGDVDPAAAEVAGYLTPVPGRRRSDDDRDGPEEHRHGRPWPPRSPCENGSLSYTPACFTIGRRLGARAVVVFCKEEGQVGRGHR